MNLSPVLFSLFINDLEMYRLNKSCDGIDIEYSDEETFVFFKFLFCYMLMIQLF